MLFPEKDKGHLSKMGSNFIRIIFKNTESRTWLMSNASRRLPDRQTDMAIMGPGLSIPTHHGD